jgi:hypothetical protein
MSPVAQGEGARACEKKLRRPNPLTLAPPDQVGGRSTSPLRGEVTMEITSRDAIASESCDKLRSPYPPLPRKRGRVGWGEGGGAPTGASNHCPRHTFRRCRLNVRGRGSAPQTIRFTRTARFGRARLSAHRRGSCLATECFDSAQAALRANGRARALPAPSVALKPSTWLPGRHAGGDDARTARVRSVSLRPQEPLPLRLKEHPRERRPS